LIRQCSSDYTIDYDNAERNGERRMQQFIFAIASFWYTAWINAVQPDLSSLSKETFSEKDLK
jgi:hypothetical protein